MSFQLNLPPSVVSQMAKTGEPEGAEGADPEAEPQGEPQETGKKREDWRKLKELEEARKAGTAPAMQDEEGRDINPHIPQYIMQAPWYFGATQPTLKHQRPQEEKQREFSSGWFKRGVKEGPVATKFRKGACENCGSMTHKKKDCLERPRKIGAKFTGTDFAPDEHIQPELAFDYDGKRDRWNGYSTTDHKRIVEEYQKIDEAKRLLKAQRVEDAVQKGEMAPEEAQKAVEDEDEEDEDKYADDVDMPGQKFETKQRITVRNLRIREDTAKYLYNLDVNSAYYDPKTRSMRENPFKLIGKQPKDLPYAGDNFVRWSGDAMEMAKQQLFAWEAYEKGSDVNLQADPTKLDMLTQEYDKKKDEYKKTTKESILDKYGGQEHLEALPKQLMAQSEEYVEYSRHGTLLHGQEKAKVKSRYEEDVYPNNHTSVWGSFWKEGQWGFACCHSFIRESYCTGSAGQEAEKRSIIGLDQEIPKAVVLSPVTEKEAAGLIQNSPPKAIMFTEQHEHDEEADSEETTKRERRHRKKEKKKRKKQKEKERKKKRKKKKKKESDSDSSESSSDSEDENAKREQRILQAVMKEEDRLMEVERMLAIDERKRRYNVTYNAKGPTEEEIEAYQRKRPREEDPMAQFI